VGDADGLDRERANPADAGLEGHDVERAGGEARLGVQRVQAFDKVRVSVDPDPARRSDVIAKVMAERDEIDEMVRMEVADEHRLEPLRWDPCRKPGEGTVTQVEGDRMVAGPDQVAGAGGPSGVGIGRPGADDGQTHETPSEPVAGRGIATR
jgi:hypothetical protein